MRMMTHFGNIIYVCSLVLPSAVICAFHGWFEELLLELGWYELASEMLGNYLNHGSRATAVWGISQLLFSVETQLISLPCRLKQCIVKTPTMYFSLKEEKWTFCLIINGMNIYFSSGPFCHKCKTLQVVQSCVDRVGFSQHWILLWKNFLLGENIGRILLLSIFRKNWIETKLMLDKLTKEKEFWKE